VRIIGGTEKFLPVRTDNPLPKGEIFAAMEKIKKTTVTARVRRGDVIIKDIYPGINIISCANAEKQ